MTSVASAPGRERSVNGHDVSAALAGDKPAFAALVERHRAELHLHCYRLVGSTQDAEDLVQETFLRAWSKRASFQGRSTFRAWLYGIATNACLDALRRRPRRVTPPEIMGPADPRAEPEPATDVSWLEPYPDRLLENVVASGVDPEAMLIRREATELVPGRMRALATASNRQPALGVYIRCGDGAEYQPFALIALTVEAGAITEMALFQFPRLFALCGLPAVLRTDL